MGVLVAVLTFLTCSYCGYDVGVMVLQNVLPVKVIQGLVKSYGSYMLAKQATICSDMSP